MKIVRADEVGELATMLPPAGAGLGVNWLEGPVNGAQLDVGLVTLTPGGTTPPHVHIGGQFILVLAGEGFVETGGERVNIGPGDVVICPRGELHSHGAGSNGPMAHLTVTTGGYEFPGPE
jgi:quercetin dioxygenase-like cupin family protein